MHTSPMDLAMLASLVWPAGDACRRCVLQQSSNASSSTASSSELCSPACVAFTIHTRRPVGYLQVWSPVHGDRATDTPQRSKEASLPRI